MVWSAVLIWKEREPRLASSRFSSNSPDLVDIAAVLDAFQETNRVRVTVEIQLADPGEKAILYLQATAWMREEESGGQLPLVLQSARRALGPRQTMEAAIFQLLYALDFQFAEDEFARTAKAE